MSQSGPENYKYIFLAAIAIHADSGIFGLFGRTGIHKFIDPARSEKNIFRLWTFFVQH